jgi:antirestriction protein ArdC
MASPGGLSHAHTLTRALTMTTVTKQTIYERITGNIIAALERGVAPRVRPWVVSLPFNAVSRPARDSTRRALGDPSQEEADGTG